MSCSCAYIGLNRLFVRKIGNPLIASQRRIGSVRTSLNHAILITLGSVQWYGCDDGYGIYPGRPSWHSTALRPENAASCSHFDFQCVRHYCDERNGGKKVTSLFIPVPVKPANNPDDINIGEELGGSLKNKKEEVLDILNQFAQREGVKNLAEENGLDENLFQQAFTSFRNMIIATDALEVDLHIILSDILVGAGHVDDIFPYFLHHARQVFPALDCMEDLKKISDLTDPAQWYPEARAIKRKIIFHAGPTNSGKTYHALQRFSQAKTGVYCGPLKLLANEVERKTNERGILCDLVTGEERKFADPDGLPSCHVACTVEMTSVIAPYEIAVIDEIQMLRDPSRGWAWTRALLGVAAQEVHLCGEEAAFDLVQDLLKGTDDSLEIRRYERLTPLTILDKALDSLENVRPGDCIVAFNKNDLYTLSRKLEDMGKECAVIYGSLPPGTKLNQSSKFNDPDDTCKILIATDAIGMGLNLSMKRVIFYSLKRPFINENGEIEHQYISTSQALQIAGRAGRYGTEFEEGEATTFYGSDLPILKGILAEKVEDIQAAGLHPTAEQIELFAYHLPDASVSNLIDIFVNLSKVETNYFVCNMDDFKFLADMVQHIPLYLRARYVFCCAPINKKHPFVCAMFLKFARQYSRNEPITFDWFCRHIGWPVVVPKTIRDLMHLETVHEVMDLYLWLSYRFMDMFPHTAHIRDIQQELDGIIQQGVINITRLIRATQKKSRNTISLQVDNIPKQKSHVTEQAERSQIEGDNQSSPKPIFRPLQVISDLFRKQEANQNAFPKETERQRYSKPQQGDFSVKLGDTSGKLSQELIQKGLLSSEVMEQLKREWREQERLKGLESDESNSDDNTKN